MEFRIIGLPCIVNGTKNKVKRIARSKAVVQLYILSHAVWIHKFTQNQTLGTVCVVTDGRVVSDMKCTVMIWRS